MIPALVLDCETTDAAPLTWHEWARNHFRPARTWKDETVGARWRELESKAAEKAALMDAAPVVCAAVATPSLRSVWHAGPADPPQEADGGLMVNACGDEVRMLRTIREWLDAHCDDQTIIVGHYVRFDLSKLRGRYLVNGLRPPAVLNPAQPHFCTMKAWCRSFSIEDREFIGLNELAARLGVQSHKNIVDGSKVPELWKSGQHLAVATYCALDTICELEIYSRLTGTSTALQ